MRHLVRTASLALALAAAGACGENGDGAASDTLPGPPVGANQAATDSAHAAAGAMRDSAAAAGADALEGMDSAAARGVNAARNDSMVPIPGVPKMVPVPNAPGAPGATGTPDTGRRRP